MKAGLATGVCLLLSALFSCTSDIKNEASWTHFRGDELNGISVEENIPLQWDDSTNISWKTPVPGRGWSSPVILGQQVWLTAATEDGKELRALCLDRESGEILQNRILFKPDKLYRKNSLNTYATPTGALEDERFYAHFGRYGTACLDTRSGEILWERSDLQCKHVQGPGSSLYLYRDKLFVHMEGSDIQYIVALDKASGKTLWRSDRPKEIYDQMEPIGKKAYTTPVIVNAGGKDVMISNGSGACIAYDPDNGEELWRIVYGDDTTIAMPTESDGIVYLYMAFEYQEDGKKNAKLIALDPANTDDSGNPRVLWQLNSPPLQQSSPLVKDGLLYTVASNGIMHCIEASSGETVWSRRMKGKFNSSPVWADGHLYFSSTRGSTHVLKEGREMEFVAENKVEGEIWATPAITGGAIFLRTSKYLYKISKP